MFWCRAVFSPIAHLKRNTVVHIVLLFNFVDFIAASEWILHGNLEYMFSAETKNWLQAYDICANMGANLASITSTEESEFIDEQIGAYRGPFWIGLQINETEKGCNACDRSQTNNTFCALPAASGSACCNCRKLWYWTDGSDSSNFMKWSDNEPTGGHQCAKIERIQGTVVARWLWHDFNCITEYRYVCKAQKVSGTGTKDPISSAPTDTKTSQSGRNKMNDASDKTSTMIGVGTGVGAVVIAGIVIAVITVIILRRRRNSKQEKAHFTEEHTYYNAPFVSQENEDSNHNIKRPARNYDNIGNVTNQAVFDATHQHDNSIIAEDDGQVGYAEINIPASKPQQLKPKPVLSSRKPLNYAEIDFDSNQPHTDSELEGIRQYDYSSIDSLKKQGKIMFQSESDIYASTEESTGISPDNILKSATEEPQSSNLSEEEVMRMYAQPIKNKVPKSPKADHKPSPLNKAILYAVPDKRK